MSEQHLSPREVLAAYAAGPNQLEQALAGLTEAELDRQPAGGGWTIRQVVQHLADGEAVLTGCLKMALATPGATFQMGWYPGNDEWAQAMDYGGRAIAPALALFRANRQYVAEMVGHMIDRWEQPVAILWPGAKEGMGISVGWLMGMWVGHLQEHLAQMKACRE